MAQQHGAAAMRRFHQTRQRIQPRALSIAAVLIYFGQSHPCRGEIACAPKHRRRCWIAVTPGAPGFLIIGLDRLGHADMGDEAHVRLVDPHAESDRGHDHHILAGNEGGLVSRPSLRIETGVIGPHCATSGLGELLGQILHLAAGLGIDDARSGAIGHQRGDLAHRIVAMADGVADIGAVEPGKDQSVIRNAELRHHVGPGLAVRRGRQRETGDRREGIHQRTQHPVIRAEIVPPFGYAMCLVHCEQSQLGTGEKIAESRLAGAFGRDIEQVQLARTEGVLRLAPVGIGARKRGGADAVGARAAQLVVHQGDQWADDHAGALQHHGGQLVGQRFARACGHHCQAGQARQCPLHHLCLPPAKIVEAEGGPQGLARLRHGGGLRGDHAPLLPPRAASATARSAFSPWRMPDGTITQPGNPNRRRIP